MCGCVLPAQFSNTVTHRHVLDVFDIESRRSYTRETRHEKYHKEVSASGGQRRRSKRNGHRAKQRGVDFEMKVADDGKGCNGMETATDVAPLAVDESGDMEVDEIVQGMENLSAKSVPEKLCFGRSARR